jgi:ribA/ribD-fused uncharacterized protein
MQDTQLVENLRERFKSGEKLKFIFFWGHQQSRNVVTASCLSQWYAAPFIIGGQRYATAEHFMMAEKAALFGDAATKSEVLRAPTPAAAKALGRKVRGFDQATWVEHRFSIVVKANEAKFTQNAGLLQFLRQTASQVLVEASPVDGIWGIGLAADNEKANNPNLWQGLNLLGFALMQVRESVGA